MSADFTAELLLRFHREPERFRGEARRRDAPPVDNEVILKLALGRRIAFADPALNEAGTVTALQAAAAMYVRQVFFRPDATPYQMLGLAPGASAQAIKESFRLLMQLVHPDRQDSGAAWPESFAALANRAYGTLRDQHARAAYDRDAEARARVARAVQRTAAAREASLMPVVLWPAHPGGRSPLGTPMLPEWLTAGVGGFVRAHPAVAAFAMLAVGAALVIGMSLRAGPEELLTREVREVLAPATPAASATSSAYRQPAVPVANAFSTAPVAPRGASMAAEPPEQNARVASRADDVQQVPGGSLAPPPGVTPNAALTPPDGVPTAVRAMVATPLVAGREPTAAPGQRGLAESDAGAVSATALQPAAASALPPAAPSALAVTPAPPPSAPLAPAATSALPLVAPAPSAPSPPVALAMAPASPEIEALFAAFVEAYEHGRPDAFAALFDDDADTNLRRGRAAIRNEYDELFRLSSWRRMQLTRINWRRAGDRAYAKGEMAVRIGWRDGREVEQRVAVDMEIVRRDGRAVIARLSHQPKSP